MQKLQMYEWAEVDNKLKIDYKQTNIFNATLRDERLGLRPIHNKPWYHCKLVSVRTRVPQKKKTQKYPIYMQK